MGLVPRLSDMCWFYHRCMFSHRSVCVFSVLLRSMLTLVESGVYILLYCMYFFSVYHIFDKLQLLLQSLYIVTNTILIFLLCISKLSCIYVCSVNSKQHYFLLKDPEE